MRALRLHALNGPMQVDEVEEPTPATGETLVQMRYLSVNPIDIWATQGKAGGQPKMPFVPGVEGVGEANGQLVLVNGGGVGTLRDGVFQERAAVPDTVLTPLPKDVDPKQAAALGVAGATAWRVVHDFAQVTANDRVLVLGASGGVGTLVVQVARNTGAAVWGQTTNAHKTDVIREVGAQGVILATAETLRDAAKDVRPTVVIDALGDGFTGAAIDLLEPRGRLVIFGTSAGESGQLSLRNLYRKLLRVLGYGGLAATEEERQKAIQQVVAEVAAGRIHVVIDEVLPLDQANEAFRRVLQREGHGKLLLEI